MLGSSSGLRMKTFNIMWSYICEFGGYLDFYDKYYEWST